MQEGDNANGEPDQARRRVSVTEDKRHSSPLTVPFQRHRLKFADLSDAAKRPDNAKGTNSVPPLRDRVPPSVRRACRHRGRNSNGC